MTNVVVAFHHSLALEFVHQLDEELAKGGWYDPGGRWIRAGAVELVFRIVLDLDALTNWRVFCANFDISHETYRDALDGKTRSLKAYRQGRRDARDPHYMSKKDRYYARAAKIAHKLRNAYAEWYFKEDVVLFGMFDNIFFKLGVLDTGVFSRFRSFCVWSRWSKLLFVANVPSKNDGKWYNDCKLLASNFLPKNHELDEVRSKETSASGIVGNVENVAAQSAMNILAGLKKKANALQGKSEGLTILNFSDEAELTPWQRFRDQSIDIFLFEGVVRSIGVAVRRREWYVIPFRFVDGMIDWFAFMYQICYPFVIIFFTVLLFLCY